MNIVQKLIETAVKWTGYLEKKSSKDLDDFTANAGSNNYTCFARDYQKHTGQNFQAQPWCAMFVSEVFVQTFGLNTACKLLGGSLYHYCPTGVNQFRKAGRWGLKPEPGAVVFFTNGSRAYHTGIVTEVTATRVKTIEGNTSGASGVVENGGGVCRKSYALTDNRIMGYGLPDWSLAEPPKKSGWVEEDGGRRYYFGDTGEYVRNAWHEADGEWYWHDGAGFPVCSDWKTGRNGKWYYLGPDGRMLRDSWVVWKDELYWVTEDGSMFAGEMELRTNVRGALKRA